MNIQKIGNRIINDILMYSIIFTTIIFSRDTLITSIGLGFYKSFIIYLVVITILISLVILLNKDIKVELLNIKKEFSINILLFLGLIIITSLIKLDFQMYILSIIIYILIAYMFITIFKFDDFFKKLSNIMVFLSIISLIFCYAFRDTILFPNGVINSNIPIVENSSGLKFFNFELSYVVALPYYIRNFGIFREPGVYQIFLIIPLVYELLIEKKKMRYFNISILIITVFSTFSLTGIIVMILIIFTYFIKMIFERRVTKSIVRILIFITISSLILGIFLYMLNSNFSSVVNESIIKITTINPSSSARLESALNNISLFLRSPVWGNDFSVVQEASIHNTNSSISIFAIFGFFVGALHLFYLYIFSERVSNNKIIRGMVILIFLLLFNSQFLLGNIVFWIVIFSAFMRVEDKELYNYNKYSLKDILFRIKR